MKLLFVCNANACRSVLAERIALALAAEHGLALETRSCGIAAERHVAVPPEVWRALAERAVGRAPHVPQLVSRPLLAWADVVLTMTAQQREVLLDSYAEHHRKIFLLRERAGLEGDVADPIGKEWPDYRACARSIAEALERILSPG